MTCPLCLKGNSPLFYAQETSVNWELYDRAKSSATLNFYKCEECDLIFKDPSVHLNAQSEKKRYDLHVNEAADPEYDKFLSFIIEPLLSKVEPNGIGLDFGCGAIPAIQTLFKKKGFICFSYDPYFHPYLELLEEKYDFITVCETAEHFYQPHKEFALLFKLLKPGGSLGIKTGHVPADFPGWWYHRDPTHVVFYSPSTLKWIANQYNAGIDFYPNDVVLFQK